MATETADFYLRLHEEMNAPARRAREAVRQLSGGLVTAQAELKRTENALASFYRKQAAAPHVAADRRATQRRQAAGVFAGALGGGLLGGTGGQVLGGLAGGEFGLMGAGAAIAASGITSLIGLAKSAASAVFDLGKSFAVTTANALDFGQRSRLAFSALVHAGVNGKQTFDEVRREAQQLGLDVRATVDDFRLLLSAQFEVGEAKELMRAGADLQAIGADAEHIKLALLALSQIKMKGVLQAEEMRQLVNTGVSAELIYNALAKSLGKTRAEVMKMQAAREITAPIAIDAFKTAIKQKTHEEKLGDTGLKFANSKIGGMFNQGKGFLDNWFIDLGDRIEPTATRLAGSVFGLFKDLMSSPELSGFADFVVAEFQGIESWTKENWPEIAATVKSMFTDGIDGAKELWGNIKGLFTEDNVAALKNGLKDLPNTIWMLVQPFVALADAISSIMSFARAFNQANDNLGDWIGSPLDNAVGRGFLGYESNADRKKREGSTGFAGASGASAAGASVAAGGVLGGGKTVNIASLSITNQVQGADVTPGELNQDLDARMQKNLMIMLEQGS